MTSFSSFMKRTQMLAILHYSKKILLLLPHAPVLNARHGIVQSESCPGPVQNLELALTSRDLVRNGPFKFEIFFTPFLNFHGGRF